MKAVLHIIWLLKWTSFYFKGQDGGIVRVGNNATCQVKGIGSITLDGMTNIEDVYFVDGLKNNLLSVVQLVNKVINYSS